MAKPNRCSNQKERENSGMCRLPKVEHSLPLRTHFPSRLQIVLDAVADHDMYSFLDGFNGYNQVQMHPDDEEKTMFVTEWGVFVAVVMMFGLRTAPTTFQRIISEVFGDYIPAFMQIFLNDFAVYGARQDHLHNL